ncbi:uncharacterized protein LOC135348943 [Halichondria panicea]|uniref:uncharacterized protein LOC135348943 n=1 Tax=Halichondria panicea TaxID=6063 RepID=UPI00312B4949
MMESSPQETQHIPWDEYIQNKLLSSECGLTGVALLTKKGVCVYSHGTLANNEKQDWDLLIKLFSDSDEGAVSKLSLLVDDTSVQFQPIKTTLASVYGVCIGNTHRLVACSFPLGVLVCINEPPVPMSSAVKIVEEFCARIRI